ncbi:persulfide dioxygenase ETHE1, mitochondrial-like [Elysia marginata]|uniref:Persulfide dioxygenase ETHE1, mitochondrial n=1 Tax=Elysia marginata TaxID=1093978 RepID=A0AAV4H065_9GAST|nr:persulfide dioxygenase ETHE1, mitochondrial-like [Elysia marginata]
MRLTPYLLWSSRCAIYHLLPPSGYSNMAGLASHWSKSKSARLLISNGTRQLHILSKRHNVPEIVQNLAPAGLHVTCQNTRAFHPGITDDSFIFRQLLDYKSYTYTYLLADSTTNEAILIDPVIETVERDYRIIQELGLKLIAAVNTHVHADHVTGSGEMKRRVPSCKSMIAEVSKAKADLKLKAKDSIKFGQFELEVRSTPGHTNGCLSYVWHEKGMVFTGDALLIRGCGRTDFQEGSAAVLYDSVHTQIFSLPQHFKVFPAHDYTGQTMSTVGEEIKFNPRLRRSKSEFTDIMNNLKLPYPKQIDKALPANMVCGIYDDISTASSV